MDQTPKEGFAFRIEFPDKKASQGQLSRGEEASNQMIQILGMLPHQYYTRKIRTEDENVVLEECFQFAVLPDSERDIHIEYRKEVGDIHIRMNEDRRIEEIAEASWMHVDEQSAMLQLEEEKEKYPPGQHPDEVMTAAALF